MLFSKTRVAATFLFALVLFSAASVFAENKSTRFYETSSMRDETRYVVKYLERIHYLSEPIDNVDADDLLEGFITDLDPHHLFFEQTEIDGFKKRFSKNIGVYLKQGKLFPAFTIFDAFWNNSRSRIKWVLQRLEGNFEFEGELTYAPDRSESEWPKTEEEANILWEKRLRYELLNEILSQASKKDEEETEEANETADIEALIAAKIAELESNFDEILTDAKDNVRKRYKRNLRTLNEIEGSEVQETFLNSLTRMYDPHSSFLSADSLDEFAISMRNSFVGIGANLLDEEGYCTIKGLLPGGPAELSNKLQPEDRIVGVGQGKRGEMVDVIGLKIRKIVKMIRGKKGSTVRLLISPANGDPGERKEISLERDEIQLTAKLAKAEVFQVPYGDRTIPIGVIDLPAFYGSSDGSSSTTHDVNELIVKLKEIGVEGIVLDLRSNGGGLLSEAISLTGLFIPEGPVVQVRTAIGQIRSYLDEDPAMVWDGPLIVLVSRYSASASEIAAGALKNHGRALIVGDKETHGKGTVQAVFEINQGGFLSALKPKQGAAKVTIQKYYLPDGSSTQIKGVSSDIVLPSYNEFLPIGEGDLPHAMEWDTIGAYDFEYGDTFTTTAHKIGPPLVTSLSASSAERLKEIEEFDYLKDSIAWFKKRQEQEDYSLNLEARIAIREKDNLFRKRMKERIDSLAAHNFKSEEVLLEVTKEQNAIHDQIVSEKEAALNAKQENGDETTETASAEEEKEDSPGLDIHLRESLRIMTDWVNYTPATIKKEEVAVTQKQEKGA